MALSTTEKTTFRTQFIYDRYDGTETPIIALNDYNKVKHSNFISDTQLDNIYNAVILENSQFLQAYTDYSGSPQEALANDPVTAIYRAMRKRCFQQMLMSSEYIKAMYASGASEQIVDRIIQNMKDTMQDDNYSKIASGQLSGSVSLQRG